MPVSLPLCLILDLLVLYFYFKTFIAYTSDDDEDDFFNNGQEIGQGERSFALPPVAAIFFCLVLSVSYVWLNGHLTDDPDNTTENWLSHLSETTETRRGTESSLPSTSENLNKVQLWNDTAKEISDIGAGQYKSMSYHLKPIHSAKKAKYQYQNGNCKLVNAISQDGQLRTSNEFNQDEHMITSQENASLCLGKTCGEIGEHFIQVKVRDGRCINRRDTVTPSES